MPIRKRSAKSKLYLFLFTIPEVFLRGRWKLTPGNKFTEDFRHVQIAESFLMLGTVRKGGIAAGILGLLCPGLGHLYNGKAKTAFLIPLVFVFLSVLLYSPITRFAGPLWIYFIYAVTVGAWIWFIVDAFKGKKESIVSSRVSRILIYLGFYLLVSFSLILALWTIRQYAPVDLYHIPANSMAPTLASGDYAVVNRAAYRANPPQVGEVVVFRYPRDESVSYVKRVIATGGQTVEVKNKELLVNGSKVERKPATDPGLSKLAAISGEAGSFALYTENINGHEYHIYMNEGSLLNSNFGPIVVPEGFLFVFGDHRDRSADSRIFGAVAIDKVIGRPEFVYFSRDPESGLPRWSRINHRIQ